MITPDGQDVDKVIDELEDILHHQAIAEGYDELSAAVAARDAWIRQRLLAVATTWSGATLGAIGVFASLPALIGIGLGMAGASWWTLWNRYDLSRDRAIELDEAVHAAHKAYWGLLQPEEGNRGW